MNPKLLVAIEASNRTGAGFGQAVADANQASAAIVAAGDKAAAGSMRQGAAMQMLGRSSAAAAAQQRNLVFQLNDVAVSLASGMNPMMVFMQQGSQIASIYGPEEGGVGRALKETGNLAVGLVTKFAPIAAAVGAGAAALAGMQAEINKTSEVQVSFGDVALATWQTFSEGVYSIAQPAIAAIGGWVGGLWEMVRPHVLTLGNGLIATFLGAYDSVKIAWGALPAVMGDIAISTANNVLGGVESMVNGSIALINDLIGLANEIPGVELDAMGQVTLKGFENPYEGAAAGLGKDVAGALQGAFSNDYLGGLFEMISGRAQDNAMSRLAEEADEAGKSVKGLGEQFIAANDNAQAFARTASEDITGGLMSIWQTFRSGGNVLEAITNQLMSFADQLMSQAIQSFLFQALGGVSSLGIGASRYGGGGGMYLADFEGGGYTGGGARAGGLDGKGGFMAMVHPNEQVIDLSRPGSSGGSQGGETRVVIALGAGLEASILQQAGNQSVQIVRETVPGMIDQRAPLSVSRANRNRSVAG